MTCSLTKSLIYELDDVRMSCKVVSIAPVDGVESRGILFGGEVEDKLGFKEVGEAGAYSAGWYARMVREGRDRETAVLGESRKDLLRGC